MQKKIKIGLLISEINSFKRMFLYNLLYLIKKIYIKKLILKYKLLNMLVCAPQFTKLKLVGCFRADSWVKISNTYKQHFVLKINTYIRYICCKK